MSQSSTPVTRDDTLVVVLLFAATALILMAGCAVHHHPVSHEPVNIIKSTHWEFEGDVQ